MKDETIHTLSILKTLITKYGYECLGWDPVVIQKSLYEDFQASKINVYKALASVTVIQSDKFWSDWHTFHFIAQAFNNLNPSSSTIQEMSVSQLMVAVDTANMVRRELGDLSYVPVFKEEVCKFIAAQAMNQGVWFLPAPLDFASPYASKTVIVCNDCHNEEYFLDEDDEICGNCTGKYDLTSLASNNHNEERLKQGFGTNTEVVSKHSTLGVQHALQKLLSSGPTPLDENNPDHVCAAKLYTAVQYLLKRRREAKDA